MTTSIALRDTAEKGPRPRPPPGTIGRAEGDSRLDGFTLTYDGYEPAEEGLREACLLYTSDAADEL